MATKEIKEISNIVCTLPLIAFCLPLFGDDRVKAVSNCPFETYLRVDNKCLDISEPGLESITAELNPNSVREVSREIKQVSKELKDLSEELEEVCVERPKTIAEAKTLEDVCQY